MNRYNQSVLDWLASRPGHSEEAGQFAALMPELEVDAANLALRRDLCTAIRARDRTAMLQARTALLGRYFALFDNLYAQIWFVAYCELALLAEFAHSGTDPESMFRQAKLSVAELSKWGSALEKCEKHRRNSVNPLPSMRRCTLREDFHKNVCALVKSTLGAKPAKQSYCFLEYVDTPLAQQNARCGHAVLLDRLLNEV